MKLILFLLSFNLLAAEFQDSDLGSGILKHYQLLLCAKCHLQGCDIEKPKASDIRLLMAEQGNERYWHRKLPVSLFEADGYFAKNYLAAHCSATDLRNSQLNWSGVDIHPVSEPCKRILERM
ncbi:MAG: hypothetical protein V4534_08055 [Myxococcota bacterium]